MADLKLFVFQEKLVGQKSTKLHQLILNGEVEEVEKLLSKGGGTDIFLNPLLYTWYIKADIFLISFNGNYWCCPKEARAIRA